jgi:hypothetical protein
MMALSSTVSSFAHADSHVTFVNAAASGIPVASSPSADVAGSLFRKRA